MKCLENGKVSHTSPLCIASDTYTLEELLHEKDEVGGAGEGQSQSATGTSCSSYTKALSSANGPAARNCSSKKMWGKLAKCCENVVDFGNFLPS